MAIGDAGTDAYHDLSSQISKWSGLERGIKENAKENLDLRVSGAFKGAVMGALMDTVSQQRAETSEHVDAFARAATSKDPESLKEAITTLGKLKKLIHATSTELFTEFGESPGEKVQEEQERLSVLVGKIDTVIFAVGSQGKEKKTLFGKMRDFISSPTPRKAPQSKIAAHRDPEANDTLKSKVESDVWKDSDHVKQENFDTPSEIPGKLMQQKLLGREKTDYKPTMMKGSQGKDIEVPRQMDLDISRSTGFKVNDKLEYTNTKSFEKTTADAFKNLCVACGKNKMVGTQKGDLLGYRIGCLIDQNLGADLWSKVTILNSEAPDKAQPCNIKGIIWSVDVKDENKITLTLKLSFAFQDPEKDPKGDYGAMIAKREIEIPLKSLLGDDLKTNPLTDVKVTDSYSKFIPSAAYAETILDYF